MVSSIVLLIGSILMMFKTDWHLAVTAIVSVFAGLLFPASLWSRASLSLSNNRTTLPKFQVMLKKSIVATISSFPTMAVIKPKIILIPSTKICTIACEIPILLWDHDALDAVCRNFGYVMVCIVGAVLTINGDITIGTIVAFMTYVRIFTQPIGQMAQGITQLQSASAAMGRVFEFLDEEEMEDESQKHANWKCQRSCYL